MESVKAGYGIRKSFILRAEGAPVQKMRARQTKLSGPRPYVRRRLRSMLQWRRDGRGKGYGAAHQRWPNEWFARHGLLTVWWETMVGRRCSAGRRTRHARRVRCPFNCLVRAEGGTPNKKSLPAPCLLKTRGHIKPVGVRPVGWRFSP